jgi:hypothetical protein
LGVIVLLPNRYTAMANIRVALSSLYKIRDYIMEKTR